MGVGNSSTCWELCANSSSRHQNKDAVLEALGIGSLKQIKREQMEEDQQNGTFVFSKANTTVVLGDRLSTIGEEEDRSQIDMLEFT